MYTYKKQLQNTLPKSTIVFLPLITYYAVSLSKPFYIRVIFPKRIDSIVGGVEKKHKKCLF